MTMDAHELGRWTRFASKGGIGRCTATQDCIAEGAEDLMFMKGDEIVVLMQLPGEDDMYLGYCESVVGRFRGTDVRFHSRLKKPVMTKRSSRSLSRSSSRPSSSQSTAAPPLVSKDTLSTVQPTQRTSPSLPPPSRLSYSYSAASISVTEDTSTTSTLSSPRHYHASPLLPPSPLLPTPASLQEENQHLRSASHSSGSTALDSAPRTPADFGKEEHDSSLVRIVSLSRQVDSPTQLTEEGEGTLPRDISEDMLAQVKAEAHRTHSQQTISAQRTPSPVSVKESEAPESPPWLDTSEDVSSRISVAMSDGEVGIGLSLLTDFLGGDGDDASSTYSAPNRNSLAASFASRNINAPGDTVRQSAVVSERSSVYSTASHPAGLEGPHPPFAASLRSSSSRASMHPSISDSEYGGEEWEGASDIYDNYRYSRYSVASKASRLSRGSMYTVASGLGLEPPPPVPSDGHRPSLDSVRQGAGRERLTSVTTSSSSVEELRVVGSPQGSPSSMSVRDVPTGKRVPPPLELSAAQDAKQKSVVAVSPSPSSTTSPLLHGTFNSPMSSPALGSPSLHSPGSPPLTAPGFSNIPGGAASALRQRLAEAQEHAAAPEVLELSEQDMKARARKSSAPVVFRDAEHEAEYEQRPSQSQSHASSLQSPPTSPTSPSANSEKKRMIETTYFVTNQAPPPPYTPMSSAAGPSSQATPAPASTPQPQPARQPSGLAPSDRPVGVAIPRPQNAQSQNNAFTRRSLFAPHPHAPKPAEIPSGPMYGRQPVHALPSGPVSDSALNTLHMALAARGDPMRPRMVTIYGRCEPDLASSIGPVPIRFSLEPLNSIPANRVRTPGPAPVGLERRPTGEAAAGAAGGSGVGGSVVAQEQGPGKVIPRANFFPKAQTPRPRSRSFSGFDTAETEVIIPPESGSRNGEVLHALTKRSKSAHVPSSSSSPALSSTPPAVTQTPPPATPATAKQIHKPSPLSLSQNNIVAASASPPLSPPLSPRIPSSPLAQPPVTALSPPGTKPSSPTNEPRQPSPNLSLGQASSALTSPTLTSPTLPPEPPTARPMLRQVSGSSSGHSTQGPATPVSPTKHRPFHVLRHSRSSTLSHRPSGSSGRDLSPQSRSSMQGRRSGETDVSHTSDARSTVVSPTPSAAPTTMSLRSKLSLPTLKIRVSDRISQHEDRSPTLSATPSDYSDQPTVSVKDLNFELVKPAGSLASIREDPLRSPPLPSPGVRSEFGNSLRADSPAMSMLSASSGRTAVTQPEPVRRTPSVGPTPADPQEVEAHRQRELRWISMMAAVPASQARKNKKVRKLLWEGVPASVRYLVWAHLTDSKAKRMEGLYAKLVKRERVPASASIERDVGRVFASEPPLLDGSLVNLLQAYLSMVPDVQYGRGLTVIAGHLLLHSPEEDAFWTFVSLMDSHLRLYFSAHPVQMEVDASLFGKAVEANEPAVAKKVFIDMAIPPASLCRPWFTALFMEALPSEHAQRVWDIFLFDGVAFLIRAGLAIIQCCKQHILKNPEREAVLNTLLHPPASLLPTNPDTFLEMAAAVKLKDDDVRKQRTKLEAQVKRQTQARAHTVQVTASGVPPSISLPRS